MKDQFVLGDQILEDTLSAEIEKFRSAYFHVISPNATKYATKLDKKRFYRAKQKQ